jgi:hypothetical protein
MFLSGGLIPMRPKKQAAFLSVFCLNFACALPAVAGAPFPCPKAVSSKNGNFLVFIDIQGEPRQGGVQRVELQVFSKEILINAKDKLTAPATYWYESWRWSVVADSSTLHNVQAPCPLPLITDDGEFLILLHVGPGMSGDTAVLQIYRRRDHLGDPIREGPDHGVFIKEIALKEIWPSDKLPAKSANFTDASPQWFVGGAFEFSSDLRQLIHTTRWGNTVRVNLRDGSLSQN